ncbi:MAG: RNA polymerase sigma factor RpoD/SigA [Patescibacteria group bacterium]
MPQTKFIVTPDIRKYLNDIGRIPLFSRKDKEEEDAGRRLCVARSALLKAIAEFFLPEGEGYERFLKLIEEGVPSVLPSENHRLDKVESTETPWEFIAIFITVYGYWPSVKNVVERFNSSSDEGCVISQIRLQDLGEEVRLWQFLERRASARKPIHEQKIRRYFKTMPYPIFSNIVREFKNEKLRKYWHARIFDELESVPVVPFRLRWMFDNVLSVEGEFVSANLRWVIVVAKKYFSKCQNANIEKLDAIQEGNLGLLQAIRRFLPQKGFRFSTFANWSIAQTIRRTLDNNFNIIRVPVHLLEEYRKINAVFQKLFGKLGREPACEEIALELPELDLTPEKINHIMGSARSVVSFEQKTWKQNEGSPSSVGDSVKDPGPTPEENILSQDVGETINKMFNNVLTERENLVLNLRFGLNGEREHTLEEIGVKMCLTRERIRQIEGRALSRLRRPKNKHLLAQFTQVK